MSKNKKNVPFNENEGLYDKELEKFLKGFGYNENKIPVPNFPIITPNNNRCPNCGYCPHCGCGGNFNIPPVYCGHTGGYNADGHASFY